ncbi:MAG TPA: hypothetical protein VNN62_04955 [Methylomirabilota bacterium]|jgi:hypothetical protein|nr:hypothetical protein [Methylomirabilota bacterium]
MIKELGIGILMPLFQIGSLPHHLAVKSATLFATEVLPHVRKETERFQGHTLIMSISAQESRV